MSGGNRNPNQDIRRDAIKALLTLADHCTNVQDWMAPILRTLQDKSYAVYRAAKEALEQTSVEALIDHYWACKDKSVLPFLLPRFYEVALTVEGTNAYGQQIVLHDTAGKQRMWQGSSWEVQAFANRIKQEAGGVQYTSHCGCLTM
ncbi:MAG: hypothetical protein AAF706_02830 [Bacteroidota bacterium]